VGNGKSILFKNNDTQIASIDSTGLESTRLTAGDPTTAAVFMGNLSSTYAGIWNSSFGDTPGNNYGLKLRNDGVTRVNASDELRLCNNDTTVAIVDSDGFKVLNETLTCDFGGWNGVCIIAKRTANTNLNRHLEFVNKGGTCGYIKTSGNQTYFTTSSDYRLKENAISMTGCIERLKELKPKRFTFRGDSETIFDGFFAHEVKEVVNEAVSGEKDEVDENNNPVYQDIDHSKLVALLTGALQEAVTRIETLEAQVGALITENNVKINLH
jgi:hypothetical protein